MQLISHSASQTIAFAKALARHLGPEDIVCLFGKLGSGKTVFIKGIAAGLGIDKDLVTSPTFVLIRRYDTKIPLYHCDLYRLKDIKDILQLGYEEYLYDEGITVVEWADRLEGYLPACYLKIEFQVKAATERYLKFTALGKRYKGALKKFHEDIRP